MKEYTMKQYNFIQTRSGGFFNYDDIESNQFDIEDIAHSLTYQCRWSGHTKFFYPVIQHLILSCNMAWRMKYPYHIQYEALMHDVSEAFVVDLPRPLKRLCPDYCLINENVEKALGKRFNFPHTMSPEVREIDDRMLLTEYHQLIDTHEKKRFEETNLPHFGLEPYDILLQEEKPEKLKKEFLAKYEVLRKAIESN